MVKLRDIINETLNRRNNQISFNLKKKEIKKNNISMKDILDSEIKCEKIDFE